MVSQVFKVLKHIKNPFYTPIPPKSGLVPIGGGIYTSPQQNIDVPDVTTMFSNNSAPEVDVVYDSCNVGLQLGVSYLWVRLPPIQIVYRNPNCIPPPEIESPLPPSPLFPDKLPKQSGSTFTVPEIPGGAEGTWLIYNDQFSYEQGRGRITGTGYYLWALAPQGWSETTTTINLLGAPSYLMEADEVKTTIFNGKELEYSYRNTATAEEAKQEQINQGFTVSGDDGYGVDTVYTRVRTTRFNFRQGAYFNGSRDEVVRYINNFNKVSSQTVQIENIQYGSFYREAFPLKVPGRYGGQINADEVDDTFYGTFYFGTGKNLKVTIGGTRFYVVPLSPLPTVKRKLPPPPPLNMSCCPNVRANDELLRLLLKRMGSPEQVVIFDEDLDRNGIQHAEYNQKTLFHAAALNTTRIEITNRLIGIENYPITAPKTVINPHKEGIFEQIFSIFDDGTRELHSLTELTTWMAEQDNAVLGQFHQVLEFEQDFDGDGKSINQQVVLPNIAESLKEIVLLLVQMCNGEGTKIHALVKTLAEVNNLKVNLFKTLQTVIDIQDYLDYSTNTKSVDVPLTCDLTLNKSGNDFEDFFSESTGKMTFEEWDGNNSLHDNILDLLQIASMLRANLYQRQ